jgi:hypothetical protein
MKGEGKVFPKISKVFPNNEKNAIPKSEFAHVIAQALRNECEKSSVKTIMRWSDANSRSVQNWLTGNHMPSAENLIALMRHSREVLYACLYLAGQSYVISMTSFMELLPLLKERIEEIEYIGRMMQTEPKKRR